MVPVLCGAAFKNKGIQRLLDAVVDFLPSPADKPPVEGKDPKKDTVLNRKPGNDEPFCALAFKIMTDPYVGKLTYFRVYSGSVPDRLLRPESERGAQGEAGAHPAHAREQAGGPCNPPRRGTSRPRSDSGSPRPETRSAT